MLNKDKWLILIVDDEKFIHDSVKLNLRDMQCNKKGVEFVHAYSASEAMDIIKKNPKLAVIILDVMMEKDEAGLELVKFIREDIKNDDVRILLHTGQAGIAPKKEIVDKYMIDCYLDKNVVDNDDCYAAVKVALKSHEERVKLKGFSGSIAHEMCTPLHIISLSAGSIKDKIKGQQDIEEDISVIQDTTKNAYNVIDILLNNMKKQNIDKSTFSAISMSESIKEVLKLYPFIGNEKDKIKLDLKHDFNFIGLKSLFRYVLFNLIKNSLHYFPDFPNNKITITTKLSAEKNILVFEDNGPGIPSEKLNSIFDSFTTLEKDGGTGLGLSFCRRVIESFEGSISCESSVTKYTRFILSFPKILKEKKTKTKILLVDEDIRVIKAIKILLKDHLDNLDIDEAYDGVDAVKKEKNNQYDLIIMDLEIPKINGIESARLIRSFSNVVIIAHTSVVNVRQKLSFSGINDCVKKGETDMLISTLCKWLSVKKL